MYMITARLILEIEGLFVVKFEIMLRVEDWKKTMNYVIGLLNYWVIEFSTIK